MKICCISDLHGQLPPTVPECDLLLIAGDITGHRTMRQERNWLRYKFNPWAKAQPANRTIATWGNHDRIGYSLKELTLDLTLLLDTSTCCGGLNVYGSPWSMEFLNWAFMLPEPELAKKWAAIPDNTNILLLHGPPHGYGDRTTDGLHVGSPSLTERIRKVRPRLVVCGHIHESHGVYDLDGIPIVNASLLNERYRMVNQPIVFEI